MAWPKGVKRTGPGGPAAEPAETPREGTADAVAVGVAFTPPEVQEAPQKKRPSGAQQRRMRREREAALAAQPAITPEEREFWAGQLKNLADSLRELRPWHPELTMEQARPAGEPLALTVKKYLPSAEERPEVVLLVVLLPWAFAVVRSELIHSQEVSRARQTAGIRPAPPRDERRPVRPEGLGENLIGAEVVGAPLPLPDH